MRKASAFLLAAGLLLTSASALARVSHAYSPVFSLHLGMSAVEDANVPKADVIAEIYPNPFNPRATIAFELAEPGAVELTVYDLSGRLVRRLESGSRPSGRYEATWDGRDDQGRSVSTGTYFCRLTTSQTSSTRKMTLAK